MKLYMKQKVFSFIDRFNIKDESGIDRFYVEGEIFSFGKKLHLYDMSGYELALVQQKVISFLPRFYVYMNNQLSAEIVKEFTFFKPSYILNAHGRSLSLKGDFWSHDYELVEANNAVMHLYKEWFTWGDSYALNIYDPSDTVICLAIALAVDCVIDAERANNN